MKKTKLSFALALAVVSGGALATDPAKKPATTPPAQPKPVAATVPATATAGQVRDWRAIDTNQDGLVSPEEMEKWLAANPGPLRK